MTNAIGVSPSGARLMRGLVAAMVAEALLARVCAAIKKFRMLSGKGDVDRRTAIAA